MTSFCNVQLSTASPLISLFLRNSSLHIFVHHCTFCASLHVKTSPVLHHLDICSFSRVNYFYSFALILSFFHLSYFYSTSSNPLLLRGAPDTARILCRSFTPKCHRQLRVKD